MDSEPGTSLQYVRPCGGSVDEQLSWALELSALYMHGHCWPCRLLARSAVKTGPPLQCTGTTPSTTHCDGEANTYASRTENLRTILYRDSIDGATVGRYSYWIKLHELSRVW